MKPISYGRQEIDESDIEAVTEALKADFLTQGPRVDTFEEEFAAYVGSQFAIAVSNGTAALHLSILALGIKPGQKVITTPITFAASANCVKYAGGEVVFADIDRDSYLLDVEKVRALLEDSPEGSYAGIIPVDFTGNPVDLEAFKELANKYNLWLLEDACHAPGGYYRDRHGVRQNCGNGNHADLAIFSFHPVKHIAAGEGGMITTNDLSLYKKLQMLRTHGITKSPDLLESNHGGWYYEMQTLGYNYRLTDFQAALGSSQLKRAPQWIEKRQGIAKKYDIAFKEFGIVKQERKNKFFNAFHLYVIEVRKRKELYDFLREKNIFPQVHYIPLHLMPFYAKDGWKKGDFPNSEAYYDNCLSLPMYPTLSDTEQDYVIACVKSFLA